MIKLRITLESKENVIREIGINEDLHLEKLSSEMIALFDLKPFEMASFFIIDSELNLGKEIPLIDTSEKGNDVITMSQVIISSVLNSKDTCLIYIYDFLKMWRFHIEYLEKLDVKKEKEVISIKSVGKIPSKAPELKFEIDINEESNPFKDALENFDEFNEYE